MRPIVTTRHVPAHLTRASAGVRGVLTVASGSLLLFPWSVDAATSGLGLYQAALPILLGVGLVAAAFARVGGRIAWTSPASGLASGAVSAAAAAAALWVASHDPTEGKPVELFRAFQWVIGALGMWQVYLHSRFARPRRSEDSAR